MAAGSQVIKGNWALLVILRKIIRNIKIKLLNLIIIKLKITIKIISPKRFLKKVNKLLFKVNQFLKKLTNKKEDTPNPSQPKNIKKIELEISNNNIENPKIVNQNKK